MGRAPKKPMTIRLAPELIDAIAQQVAESRRNVSVECEIAIEEYLSKLGKWPPRNKKPGR